MPVAGGAGRAVVARPLWGEVDDVRWMNNWACAVLSILCVIWNFDAPGNGVEARAGGNEGG